ncbi:hypothetical protein [Methylocucumis oryzae]|uniref:hypothetical protein n=1 Tax=Methylocucumis oryzae TaxID=1632867 RepID=UPI0012FF1FA4|nr:hypothetical protein [Methylocucumis oryzae]
MEKLKAHADVILSAAYKLNDLKHHAPALINALQELSLIIPDNTWLKKFRLFK